ncbi:hypothetical protein AWM75_03735 [Aerococcus urinaehominis]|uniref:Uncharacterized protein n=1 Tax=Aerococcus urinaehominis TaxID=128944 RepID=A0A0X8FLA4_9LACT|nr:polysaccharide biosynthesis protein [Aerococcus urinaehominis]AMB99169.1 hypothetical protein AWM75_03735 [Aerococcus urinaehominis]SDM06106.1 polysaccharide transporter, PST family [Aerococcus urinaehominis]
MKQTSKYSLSRGVVWLTLAALIAKILSAVYRVPLQNLLGNQGFYIYQQVYPFYGLATSLALSGLPNFVAKQLALQQDDWQLKKASQRLLVLALILCLVIFSVLFWGAGPLAVIMGDPYLDVAIQSSALIYLLVPWLLMGRGWFQSQQMMAPTALSQVLEQLVRVTVILLIAWWFSQEPGGDIYQLGAKLMTSGWLAALVAAIFLGGCFIYYYCGRFTIVDRRLTGLPYQLSWTYLSQVFAGEGLVTCLFTALLILLQMIDAFTLVDLLQDKGMSLAIAQDIKGAYDRGQPLVQLGMVFSLALSANYLPYLAQLRNRRQRAGFRKASHQYFRLTLLVASLVTTGLMSVLPLLNQVLFASRQASHVLTVYLAMVLLASMSLVVHNILQADNKWYYSGLALLAGLVIKYIANQILIVAWATMGAAIASLLALVTVLVVLLVCLERSILVQLTKSGLLLRLSPLLVTMFASIRTMVGLYDYFWGPDRLGDGIALLVMVVWGLVLTWVYLRRVDLISANEWQYLPQGEWLYEKFIKRRK